MWKTRIDDEQPAAAAAGPQSAPAGQPGPAAQPAPDASLDPVQWAVSQLGFTPDPFQARVLLGGKRGILNCTRQWGKSTVTAIKALYTAWTHPETDTLALGPSERQAAEFVRKCEIFALRLGVHPKGDGENKSSLLLPNGSRIIGLPNNEEKIRCFSATLIVIDEAALVPDGLYHAVRPMIAVTRGAIWMISTPKGKSGFFYDTWQKGGDRWERIRVTAYDCPRIDKDFLVEEREVLGDRKFRKDYLCEFGDNDAAVFDRDLIERALRSDIKPLHFLGR